MAVVTIDSPDDPRLAPYRNLPAGGAPGRFIVEGKLLVSRLLESGRPVESILCSPVHLEAWRPALPAGVSLFVASPELLSELAGFKFHRGVMACGLREEQPAQGDVLDRALAGSKPEEPLLVAVGIDLADPENVGGLIRAAACFGANAVVLNRSRPDPLSRRVIRVSMGAALRLPVVHSPDPLATLDRLRQRWQCQTVAAVLSPAATRLSDLPAPRRAAILFGSEGEGLPGELVSACGNRVSIPMAPGCDSLNVAMAAGIFLHHFSTRPAGSPETSQSPRT